ncbi:MAG TPA: hypothetical protein VGF33_06870 [Caulobacteraceae bacterium]|jgi:hypothetical protein
MASARLRAAERERARDPASWGLDRQALRLAVNADVEARVDPGGRVTRARRQDVFDLFFARGRLSQAALDAVRRLQGDVATLHAMAGGVGAYAERIDQTRRGDQSTDARHRAGRRIEAALALAGPANARLLLALCESDAALGRNANWRTLVERETGERLADAQGAILRAACDNLAEALAILHRRGGRSPS